MNQFVLSSEDISSTQRQPVPVPIPVSTDITSLSNNPEWNKDIVSVERQYLNLELRLPLKHLSHYREKELHLHVYTYIFGKLTWNRAFFFHPVFCKNRTDICRSANLDRVLQKEIQILGCNDRYTGIVVKILLINSKCPTAVQNEIIKYACLLKIRQDWMEELQIIVWQHWSVSRLV